MKKKTRPRHTEVISIGRDGFKIGSPEELPRDRPSVEDIALAHRRGCMPAILRFFMRRKYGTDYTDSVYRPPARDSETHAD